MLTIVNMVLLIAALLYIFPAIARGESYTTTLGS